MLDTMLLAWLTLAFPSVLAPQIPSGDFAIAGARIERGDGTIIPRGTVIVQGGRIAQVLEGAASPPGLALVNGEGKVLYPGFIDGFSTRGLKSPPMPTPPERPGVGETAPASFWEGHRKGITPEWKASENLEFTPSASLFRQGITAALLSPSRGAMRGSATLLEFREAEAADRVLRPEAGASFSFRGSAAASYPSNILGIIALTRQVLLDAQAYRDGVFEVPEKDPPAYLASLRALQPVIKAETPVFWEANMAREIERAVALSEEFGLWLVIVGGREAGSVAPLLASKGIPVLLSVDPGTEPPVTPQADTVPFADRQPEAFRQERRERWLVGAKTDQALAAAGVPFAFASDSALGSLLDGVRARIGRGLKREDALKALTMNGSRIFRLGDAGLIEPGRKASLVLMSGPFEEKDSVVESVWVAGKHMFSKEEAKP